MNYICCMKKSVKESSDEQLEWVNNGEDVSLIISDIIEDSFATVQIIEALELRLRRLEKLSGKPVAILLNHVDNKLYITTNE
jgi:hypothetical protein